jgi:capsular exopolysaccharide synthesis family protein
MSQIFDALLRSEAERGGSEPATRAEATELLRRVEGEAASKWASAAFSSQYEKTNGNGAGAVAELDIPETYPSVSDFMAETAFAQPPQAEERVDGVGRFPSLTASISASGRLVSLTDRESPTAEAFRLLSVRLRDLRRTQTLKKLLITSTIPREGKSTVAANLACALAQRTEEKILLLEGDIRRPTLMQMFDVGAVPGICDWLQGENSVPSNIYRLEGAGIWIFPAGKAPSAPLEILQSKKLPVLMDQLAATFDWVIIDSPPVLPLADTSIWSRIADGILLVARQGTTEKEPLERGLPALDSKKLLGAVLNCSKASTYSSYYYRSSAAS